MNSNVSIGKIEPEALFRRDGSARTAGAISASAGGYAIADTSTTAKVGDIYRAETATTSVMIYKQYKVIAASTNSFTIASKDLPVLGDTFYILGPVTPRHDSTGAISSTIDTTGLATSAKQDTMITSLQLLDNAIAGNEFQVDVLTSALPTGASTAANQSTIDTSINTLLKPASTLAAVTLVSTVSTVSSVTAIANALPAGTNNIGDVDILSIAAGDNNIGNVDVVTLPALAAGSNNIGDVDVLTLPALVTGSAVIGYVNPDATASGNITTQNLVPLGTATASSAVEVTIANNGSSAMAQVTGTYTGALTAQFTVDGSVWVSMSSILILNTALGTYSSTISSGTVGIFLIPVAGFTKMRISANAAVTGTAVVTIRASAGYTPTQLASYQPITINAVGGNAIGTGEGTISSSTLRVAVGSKSSATSANVSDSASSVTLLASSSSRVGATFWNDSTSILYLKFGATATTTSCAVKIAPDGYYELPGPQVYSGIIDGIWSADASGACRVTSW